MEAIADWLIYNWRRVLSWFKDDVFRRLFLNAGKLLFASVFAAVVGLVVTVLTARVLGPANYGMFALILVYEATIGKLVTFNAWQAVIKFGSDALERNDHQALRQLMKFGFCLDVGSAIVGTILAMVLAGPVVGLLGWDPSVWPLLVLYSTLIVFSLSGTPIGILRLFDRFDLLSYAAVLIAAVRLIGVLCCLITRQDLFGFVLVYLITGILGQLYQVLASLWVLRKQGVGNIVRERLRGIHTKFPGIWDYVWTTNLNSTVRMFSREADELIIACLTTPTALGLFKIAKQFAQALPRLLDPLYQSIYPELTRLWAAAQREAFASLIKRTTLIVATVGVAGWVVFVLLGQRLIVMTVGSPYSQAYPVAVLYLAACVLALATFSLHPAMLAIGLPRNSFKSQVSASVLYLIALFPLVHSLGIAGASLAYVVYYLVWTVLMMCYLRPCLVAEPQHV